MELTITASSAFELKEKILQLAEMFSDNETPRHAPPDDAQMSFEMDGEGDWKKPEEPAVKKRGRKPKSNAGTEPKADEASEAFAPADEVSAETEAQSHAPQEKEPLPITFEVVKEFLKKVNVQKGMETVRAILDKFGVKRISDLPEEKFQEFALICEQTLG